MRVEIDPAVCEANGLCEELASDIFELADGELPRVRSPITDADVPAVVEAVQACPRGAIRLVED